MEGVPRNPEAFFNQLLDRPTERHDTLDMESNPPPIINSTNDLAQEFSLTLDRQPSTRVEDFLAQSTTRRCVDMRRMVLVEIRSRVNAGEALDEQEFRGRFPQFAEEITLLMRSVTLRYSVCTLSDTSLHSS